MGQVDIPKKKVNFECKNRVAKYPQRNLTSNWKVCNENSSGWLDTGGWDEQ